MTTSQQTYQPRIEAKFWDTDGRVAEWIKANFTGAYQIKTSALDVRVLVENYADIAKLHELEDRIKRETQLYREYHKKRNAFICEYLFKFGRGKATHDEAISRFPAFSDFQY